MPQKSAGWDANQRSANGAPQGEEDERELADDEEDSDENEDEDFDSFDGDDRWKKSSRDGGSNGRL
jgi:hypothetical protein